MSKKKMTPMEMDAIGEILNISLGASATAASTMLNDRVDITTPIVEVRSREDFEISSLEPAVGVEITYVEGLVGSNIMLLKRGDVKVIVEKMMGMEIPDEEFELNEMNISAICEIMNQMMGASATALAELLSRTVNISTPVSFEVNTTEDFIDKYFEGDDPMVVIRFNLRIGDEMESEFMNVMPIGLAKELVSGFFPDGAPDEEDDDEDQTQAQTQGGDAQMDQAAIDAALAAAAAAPAEPQGGDAQMDQAAIDAALAAAAAAPAEPQGGDVQMDQAAIDAALAAAAAPAQTQGGDAQMDQAAIDAALAAAAAPAQPQGGDAQMDQAAIDAALAAAAAPAQAAPIPQQVPPMQQAMPQQAVPVNQAAAGMSTMMMQQMMEMMQQQMELQRQELQQIKAMQKAASAPKQIKVNPIPQPNLADDEEITDPDANLDLIMGVPLDVSVEIGRTKKLVKDILELNKGSLVVLNKLAGEQVDVFVNGQCIAKGDVVVVEDNFGVRITEILQDEIFVEE